MMRKDFNTEFDEEIRSMLADAEEEVPAHIMDDVFSRLDAQDSGVKRGIVLPLWLKCVSAGMAVAAAVAVCVVLWPGGEKMEVREMTAVTDDADADSQEYAGDSVLLADVAGEQPVSPVSAEASMQKMVYGRGAEDSEPQEIRGEAGEVETRLPDGTEEDRRTSGASGVETADAAETAGAADGEMAAAGEAIDEQKHAAGNNPVSEMPEEDFHDPFSGIEDYTAGRRKPRIAIAVGGDVSSNGDPMSLGSRGGLKAPDMRPNGTFIEQTSQNSSYTIPVSFGISARIGLSERWSIGAGLNYSMLQRTFSGTYTKRENGRDLKNISSDIRHTIHYVGLPVNAYYDILKGSRVKLYAYAGGAVERGIANVYRVKNSPDDIVHKDKIQGVQLSAGGGFGVEFAIVDQLGIYVNPGLRYYFDCGQPTNIRTQQPLMMNFEIGLRVGL